MEPLSLSSWPSPFIQRMFHHGDVMKIWYFIEDTGHVHGDCVHDCIASVIKRWHNCSFSFKFFSFFKIFFLLFMYGDVDDCDAVFFCFGDIGCGIHQTSSWGSREISLRECLHWQTLSPNCNLYFVNILIHFCVMIHLGFFISLKFVKSWNLNYKFFAWFHNWK